MWCGALWGHTWAPATVISAQSRNKAQKKSGRGAMCCAVPTPWHKHHLRHTRKDAGICFLPQRPLRTQPWLLEAWPGSSHNLPEVS